MVQILNFRSFDNFSTKKYILTQFDNPNIVLLMFRQVQIWCKNKMLAGAVMFGSSWAIPDTAEKPTRTKNFKPGRKPKQDADK